MHLDYDTIVIGSGAGGLAAAVALAQAGERVVVLEQHYVPGGWCHSFTLGGYRFSPGVHYIGELAPEGRMRRTLEGLGVADDLTFLELNPEGYDHVLIGRERFDIPKGKQVYAERLKARFPREARGIDAYLDGIQRFSDELGDLIDIRSPLDLLKLPFRSPALARHGLESLDRYLSRFVSDPLLKAILTIQCGDHGLPPSRAPAAIHAAVASHYFDGAYYPRGGGFALPRAFLRALKRAGGELRLSTSVSRILLEERGGRKQAIGVRLADGSELRARRVISNADPGVTFGRLIGGEHLSRWTRWRLGRTRWSISALSLFLAVDMDVRAAGLDSGNYWYARTTDIERCYPLAKGPGTYGIEARELPGLFLTVTTLKDRTKGKRGHHTIEAFSFVSSEAFRAWAASEYGNRPESYVALKSDLTQRMLAAAERILPGIREHVVFAELGTPLTNEHYVAATEGNLYGTEKSRGQIGPFGWRIKTEIADLYLCGASTIAHGVFGAMLSGLAAAASGLRVRMSELLKDHRQSLRILPADDLSAWPKEMRAA